MAQDIFCDGMGTNGKISGYCVYIPKMGKRPYVEFRLIGGDLTNNEMEYKAVYRALLLSHRGDTIHTDSELVVKQLSGEYRTKEPRLKGFLNACRKLIGEKGVAVSWCGRENDLGGKYIEEFQLMDKERKCR